jgi:hypothetical protein
MSLEAAKQIKYEEGVATFCDGKHHWEKIRISIRTKRIGKCDCEQLKFINQWPASLRKQIE